MAKLFDDERTLFRKRINELMGKDVSKSNVDELIKSYLTARGNENGRKLAEIYDLLGIDKFFDLLDITEETFVQFPSISGIYEAIQSILAFHYSCVSGKPVKMEKFAVDDVTSPNKIKGMVEMIKTSLHISSDNITPEQLAQILSVGFETKKSD
jgi:hypothetical protein